MPVEEIERIEVIRGPGGSVWGANAVNGVINIVTKKPGAAAEGSAQAEYGSFNYQRYEAAVSGPLTGPLSLDTSRKRFAWCASTSDPNCR